jgi:glycosyltransferase involved in cell wall biosynthesis
MTPRKVALVSDWFAPRTGGVERHMIDLARGLRSRGYEVEVITATPGPASLAELPGVPILRLDCPLLPGYDTVFRPRDGAQLTQLFTERGYDLIHAHSLYSPLALAAAHAGHTLRLPTVLTAHSLVRYACMAVFRALDYRLMWSSWPNLITAVSDAVANDLRRASFTDEVHVLPNGIDLPPRLPPRPLTGALRIVSVLRLVPRKRPLALLRAFASLERLLPAETYARCRLVIVGGGPMEAEMHALARRLGIADRVELRGCCTPAEVRAALAEANIFALASRKEAFGLAALEAASASLPVVILRGSGTAELFTPERDALIASSDAELGVAIARLVEDPALCARLGAQGRALAECYAWDGILDRTLTLYRLAARRAADRHGVTVAARGPATPRPALSLVGGSRS